MSLITRYYWSRSISDGFRIAFLVSNIAGTAVRDAARIGSEIGKSGGDANNRDFTSTDAATVRDALIPKLPAYLSNRSIVVKFMRTRRRIVWRLSK